MTRKQLMVLPLLLLCFSAVVVAQDKLGHLKSWDGKPQQQVDAKGRVTADFFTLPEIRTPLRRLLKPADFNLVTKGYSVGSPLKLMGDFLATTMCRPHNCGDEAAGFAVNLSTGAMYVRMGNGRNDRWIVSEGKASDLPKDVMDYIGNPYQKQQ